MDRLVDYLVSARRYSSWAQENYYDESFKDYIKGLVAKDFGMVLKDKVTEEDYQELHDPGGPSGKVYELRMLVMTPAEFWKFVDRVVANERSKS